MNSETKRNASRLAFLAIKEKVKSKRRGAPPEEVLNEQISTLQETIRKKRGEILNTRKRIVSATTSLQSLKLQRELLEQQANALSSELRSLSRSPQPDLLSKSREIEYLQKSLETVKLENTKLKDQLKSTLGSYKEFQTQMQSERKRLESQKAAFLSSQASEPPPDGNLSRLLAEKERLMGEVAYTRQHLDNIVQILYEKQEILEIQHRNQQDLVADNMALAESLNLPYASMPAEPPPEFSPIVEVFPPSSRNLVSDVGSTGNALPREEVKDSQPGPEEARLEYNSSGSSTPHRFSYNEVSEEGIFD